MCGDVTDVLGPPSHTLLGNKVLLFAFFSALVGAGAGFVGGWCGLPLALDSRARALRCWGWVLTGSMFVITALLWSGALWWWLLGL